MKNIILPTFGLAGIQEERRGAHRSLKSSEKFFATKKLLYIILKKTNLILFSIDTYSFKENENDSEFRLWNSDSFVMELNRNLCIL